MPLEPAWFQADENQNKDIMKTKNKKTESVKSLQIKDQLVKAFSNSLKHFDIDLISGNKIELDFVTGEQFVITLEKVEIHDKSS